MDETKPDLQLNVCVETHLTAEDVFTLSYFNVTTLELGRKPYELHPLQPRGTVPRRPASEEILPRA